MVSTAEPLSVAEVADVVRGSKRVAVHGNDNWTPKFRLPGLLNEHAWWGNDVCEYWESPDDPSLWSLGGEDFSGSVAGNHEHTRSAELTILSLEDLCDVIENDSSDQVVRVGAGCLLSSLNSELGRFNQCIPVLKWEDHFAPWAVHTESIGSLVAIDFPHGLLHQCGSWRDWVLGMTVVLSNGTIVKCGSKAVKSVAGYDLQRLFIGGRNSLGIIVELTLRTYPTSRIPTGHVERLLDGQSIARRQGNYGSSSWWIQRVKLADLNDAIAGASQELAAVDHASGVLYGLVARDKNLPRYPGDWVMRSGCGEKNVQITDPTQIRLMKRAKEIFDPTNKLNPGEWGFM